MNNNPSYSLFNPPLVNELSEEEIDAWRSKLNASHLGFVRGDFTQDQILEKVGPWNHRCIWCPVPVVIRTVSSE